MTCWLVILYSGIFRGARGVSNPASRPRLTSRAATAAAASAATDGDRGVGAFAGLTRSTQVRSFSRSTSIWRAVFGPSR